MVVPKVGVGYSETEDSFLDGQEMARAALARGGLDSCGLALLFSTCQHQPEALRAGVRSVIGPDARLAGGWAVGTMCNEQMGYGGFQAGIACFSMSLSDFSLFRVDGLADREADAGEELGNQLVAAGADKADIPKLILYDSINRLSGRTKLNMATPLLAGIRKAIPRLSTLVGAGLVGDMAGQPTFQWFDDDISQQSAIALTFSPDIALHTAILRGASMSCWFACKKWSPMWRCTQRILTASLWSALVWSSSPLGSAFSSRIMVSRLIQSNTARSMWIQIWPRRAWVDVACGSCAN